LISVDIEGFAYGVTLHRFGHILNRPDLGQIIGLGIAELRQGLPLEAHFFVGVGNGHQRFLGVFIDQGTLGQLLPGLEGQRIVPQLHRCPAVTQQGAVGQGAVEAHLGEVVHRLGVILGQQGGVAGRGHGLVVERQIFRRALAHLEQLGELGNGGCVVAIATVGGTQIELHVGCESCGAGL
jgi:hypothetical protein